MAELGWTTAGHHGLRGCSIVNLKVTEAARLFAACGQTTYVWRRQHLIDTGQLARHEQ
ncbi:hypothetical protein AB0O75_39415 [Streptomyces sp. NPDC088921]|uniref:hypothetical protein n=1 Tax=unclassified Streptomyces TaxID=2593676 RepID=UPI003446B45F